MKIRKITSVIFCFIFVWLLLAGLLEAQDKEKISPQIVSDIEQMQKEIKAKGYSFTVGYNEAMKHTIEQLTGYRRAPEEVRAMATFDVRQARSTLPKRWNWMDHNGVSSIKNQRPAGTCWAFATVGAMEGNVMIHEGSEIDLSEQYIVSCNHDGYECNTGGSESHKYHCCDVPPGEYASDGQAGAVLEGDFEYMCADPEWYDQDPDTPPCKGVPEDPLPRAYCIDSWSHVGSGGIPPVDQIKQAIFDYGPVYAAVVVERFFQSYTGGIFDRCRSGGGNTNHAIVLAGWDDTMGENGIWYLKNSWGTDWGEQGFMRIQYECNLVGDDASYVVYKGGVRNPYGIIALDSEGYPCEAVVGIILRDSNLAGTGNYDVTITTDGGDSETVNLVEDGDPGDFFGEISSAEGTPHPEDGNLQVSPEDIITATYIDAEDGRGGTNITKEYTAYVDCALPDFEGLASTTTGNGYVELAWNDADDPHGPIKYKIYRDQIQGQIGELIATTSGLIYRDYNIIPEETYCYVVRAVDVVGNEDDNTVELCAVPSASLCMERVSVDNNGMEGDNDSQYSSICADGRFVAFESSATNLVPEDNNGVCDIFVNDRDTGDIERVSVSNGGMEEGDRNSNKPSVSADGRFVAFESSATNLVPGDTNRKKDVFVFDRENQTIERVSLAGDYTQGNKSSYSPAISADGRYVAFHSFASNLVSEDTNGKIDVFVYDRVNDTIQRVSVADDGAQGDGSSSNPSISADGQFVAFESSATNLVPGDANDACDIFVYDRDAGAIVRVTNQGIEGDKGSSNASISADGQFVAFHSSAINLVPGDTNERTDVFVYDRNTSTIEMVSIAHDGTQGIYNSVEPDINSNGRYVAFQSSSSNLVPGDTNDRDDIFVYDRTTKKIERISIGHEGSESDGASKSPDISADGRYVAFESTATNLVADDTNGHEDTFVVGPIWVSDSDGDGIPDDGDYSGVVGDNPCTGGNIYNCDDNCRMTPNPNQENTDEDEYGNACDCDIAPAPGDGMVNLLDKIEFMRAFWSQEGDARFNPDADFTGPGSVCDGRVNFLDKITLMQRWNQPPGD